VNTLTLGAQSTGRISAYPMGHSQVLVTLSPTVRHILTVDEACKLARALLFLLPNVKEVTR